MRSGPMPAAKPVNSFRVIAAIAQHGGVDHAAAQDLKPAGSLADGAALAAAYKALHVHLTGRLCEGEVRGAQAGADIFSEHAPGEFLSVPFRSPMVMLRPQPALRPG
jgi:hypothetical protein